MKIAISGLGRMGMQIARKLAESPSHEVIVHNRSREPVIQAEQYGAAAGFTKEEVVRQFGDDPVIIWMMLPENIMDDQIAGWLKLLPKGSILIDGGNSDFRKTKQREPAIKKAGIELVDIGTSGGVWGYKNGFSMMAGGSPQAFQTIEPALKTLAKPAGGYQYFGPSGSGHFVKMVHNAIEYGMMESLAEGYRMLKEGPYKNIDLAAAGEVWQQRSVITSWLNELCWQIMQENPNLDDIEGVVAESGEARWTLEVAKEIGLPLPTIQTAFDVRLASQKGEANYATKLLAAMRNKFGGHTLNQG
jgi:6-phosphogluconate dehydrogenase